MGPSPPTRGNLTLQTILLVVVGTIPAYTGEPTTASA